MNRWFIICSVVAVLLIPFYVVWEALIPPSGGLEFNNAVVFSREDRDKFFDSYHDSLSEWGTSVGKWGRFEYERKGLVGVWKLSIYERQDYFNEFSTRVEITMWYISDMLGEVRRVERSFVVDSYYIDTSQIGIQVYN